MRSSSTPTCSRALSRCSPTPVSTPFTSVTSAWPPAGDEPIFDHAAAERLVVITADGDFSMLLATRRTRTPSVVLLRDVAELRPDAHAQLLIANLPAAIDDLDNGAVVSLSRSRLAVRRLPIGDH